ncbi:MAG: hypothetical protein AAGF20_08115, partial [Pseudomonadota bacterium]
MVVSGGQTVEAMDESSNPTTDKSSGTVIPARAAAARAPAAKASGLEDIVKAGGGDPHLAALLM